MHCWRARARCCLWSCAVAVLFTTLWARLPAHECCGEDVWRPCRLCIHPSACAQRHYTAVAAGLALVRASVSVILLFNGTLSFFCRVRPWLTVVCWQSRLFTVPWLFTLPRACTRQCQRHFVLHLRSVFQKLDLRKGHEIIELFSRHAVCNLHCCGGLLRCAFKTGWTSSVRLISVATCVRT